MPLQACRRPAARGLPVRPAGYCWGHEPTREHSSHSRRERRPLGPASPSRAGSVCCSASPIGASVLAGPGPRLDPQERVAGRGCAPRSPARCDRARRRARAGGDDVPLASTSRMSDDLRGLLEAVRRAPAIYFALPPAVTAAACRALEQVELPEGTQLALEKPFGTDRGERHRAERAAAAARARGPDAPRRPLPRPVHGAQPPRRCASRTASSSRSGTAEHIERVDVVYDETLGLENRARYYDKAGALIDMIQSHLLQVLAVLAMEPPATLDAHDLRDAKAAVLRATRVWDDDPRRASVPPRPLHRRDVGRPEAAVVRRRGGRRPVAEDRDARRGRRRGRAPAVGGRAVHAALGQGARAEHREIVVIFRTCGTCPTASAAPAGRRRPALHARPRRDVAGAQRQRRRRPVRPCTAAPWASTSGPGARWPTARC